MSDSWLIGAGAALCSASVALILSLVISLIWSVEREYAVAGPRARPSPRPREPRVGPQIWVRVLIIARNTCIIGTLGFTLAYAAYTISHELK